MTRWSLFLQTLSLLHHFLGLYFWRAYLRSNYCYATGTVMIIHATCTAKQARQVLPLCYYLEMAWPGSVEQDRVTLVEFNTGT